MDDRLIYEAKHGNQNDFAEIYRQYEPLVISMAEKYYNIAVREGLEVDNSDFEDLKQESVIALYSAVRSYDIDIKEVTFGLYAKICIRNRLISELRRYKPRFDKEALMPEIHDSPEVKVIEREDYNNLLSIIDQTLSDYEKSVLSLYIQGKSYRDIAERLDKTEKSVDSAIYRIKGKLREHI